MLTSVGLGAGAYVLSGRTEPFAASADAPSADELPLLIYCEFAGAWDTLLCLDPRDNTDSQFNQSDAAIYTGYNMVADEDDDVAQVMANNNSGLVRPTGSNIAFGPAIGNLASHFQDIAVVRGVDMGTLTHEVGRRYFLTGKFPRGLAASGSSLGTFWVNEHAGVTAVPNLVVRAETYNEGLDPRASGLNITDYQDLATVLKSLTPSDEPSAQVAAALAKIQNSSSCLGRQLDVGGKVAAYQASYEKAIVFGEGTLWKYFDFVRNPDPQSDIYKIYQLLGLNPANPNQGGALSGPKGQAAIAAQALTRGVTQAVTIQLATGIDHHDEDWASDHAPALRQGFDALAGLIDYLKQTEDKNGKSYWDRTTVVAVSDFARTPGLNPRGGRDHHLSSACLVAGNGIKGNQVIGSTNDLNYGARPTDLTTGASDDEMGTVLRPPDVHRTILNAVGMPYEHISNQDPVLIPALIS
jgi:hypothetical protein